MHDTALPTRWEQGLRQQATNLCPHRGTRPSAYGRPHQGEHDDCCYALSRWCDMLTASADATLRLCEPLEQAYGMPHSAVSQRGSSMGFESPNMGTNVAVSTSAGRVRDATDVCSAVAVRATAARTCVPQALRRA